MTWLSPMTAVATSVFTAAQWNTYVRDNLNETAPAKSTQLGSYFIGSGPNSIVEEFCDSSYIATAQSTASTSYVNLATVGPSVTVNIQTRAMVFIYGQLVNSLASQGTWISYDVSGATTDNVQADMDTRAILLQGDAGDGQRVGVGVMHENLNAGSNTFTAKYRMSGGTGTFSNRRIAVMPF